MTVKRKAIISASWLLVAICMAIIFSLSHQPASESSELSMNVMGFFARMFTQFIEAIGHDAFRSIAHALEYCGLALLLFNAFCQTSGKPRMILSFAAGVFYAVTDEVHQIFIEGRAFQFTDILIDTIGTAFGIAASYVIYITIHYILKQRRGNELEKE